MRISDWSSDVCSSDLTNAKRSRLHRVDLATGADQELRTSPWFSQLQALPGSDDWSVLADLGEGVQLYRVDGTQRFTPLLINHETARLGGGDAGSRPFGKIGRAHVRTPDPPAHLECRLTPAHGEKN